MKIEDEIKINQFGQSIYDNEYMLDIFEKRNLEEKREYLEKVVFLILQSKSNIDDVESAIQSSGLKATFTPCVLLRKGIDQNNLFKICKLPENEINKSFLLLINFFKIGYKKRYDAEKNEPNKWWYWDLSKTDNIDKIVNN